MVTFSPKHQFILFDSRIFSKTERKKFRDPEDLSPNFHDTEIWPKLFRGSEILSELFRGPEKHSNLFHDPPKHLQPGFPLKTSTPSFTKYFPNELPMFTLHGQIWSRRWDLELYKTKQLKKYSVRNVYYDRCSRKTNLRKFSILEFFSFKKVFSFIINRWLGQSRFSRNLIG